MQDNTATLLQGHGHNSPQERHADVLLIEGLVWVDQDLVP